MENKRERGLYRSRGGVICGVCRGLGEYFGFSVFWLRVIVALLFFFTVGWPMVFFYFLAAFMLKPEPVVPFASAADQEFYNSYAHSRRLAQGRLRRTFERLNRRLQRLESVVTGREYDWEQRLKE